MCDPTLLQVDMSMHALNSKFFLGASDLSPSGYFHQYTSRHSMIGLTSLLHQQVISIL